MGCISWNLDLYFHGEHSVGTAMSRHLLVRGTKNGQRKFTEQRDNCTVTAPVQALAEEITSRHRERQARERREADEKPISQQKDLI